MVKIAITVVVGNLIRQVSPGLHQTMDEEMRRNLCKTELTGSNHWLVRLVPRLDDAVRGTHANMQKSGTDHKRIQMPEFRDVGQTIEAE